MSDQAQPRSWREALAIYRRPEVLILGVLGFSGGLPYLLTYATLSGWLDEFGVDIATIGFFSWVGITYSIKVLWAPVVDRISPPLFGARLGQRRGWMLWGQLGVITGLAAMADMTPSGSLIGFALLAIGVAFASATQDVAIDAYRVEVAQPEYQGALSAAYIFGYRSAMLVGGAGVLYLADLSSWSLAYLIMAGLMLVGVVTVLRIREPEHGVDAETRARERMLERRLHVEPDGWRSRLERWFVDAVVAPFNDFFQRNGLRFAWMILALVGLYKLSDISIGVMALPFYQHLGFSKTDIAGIGKLYGFVMTIAGSFLGGLFVARYGVLRPLMVGAVLVAITNLLFAKLATIGADLRWLAVVISADNLGAGFSNAAFIAYLSSLTNRAYTATQYALFSSLMTLPGKIISGFSGIVVGWVDYSYFFIYTTCLGAPAILLCLYMLWRERSEQPLRSVG